jgi:signal transduction histidine kinase/DNA-binding response OmpR family regulator
MSSSLLTIEIRRQDDVVLARQKARSIAAALKFDSQDQTRIATAVSEIARNTFQYAGGGFAEFTLEAQPESVLTIILRDHGKGIPHLKQIMEGKYVSQTGMGLGIIGAKRLMDSLVVESTPGSGTTVVLRKRAPGRTQRLDPESIRAQISGTAADSRNPYEELKEQNRELLRAMDELRARQDELAQLNRELDETNRGVVALYAELNDKADFLQRASELKSHFLSNMSHEFRTPLNSVTALSQILLDRLDGELTAEQEKQVRYIRKSAQDLTELVNDLLDLAKVEAGKITIRPTSFLVEGLFAAMRGMLRPLLSQNSSINLVFEDPENIPEMYSDEARISQILRNFVSNALKFTERGEVRVSASLGENDTVVFTVSDTGIGIAAEDQERIFQEWTQVEGELQKRAKGTGLGLPLSRKFANLLGGNVFVKSRVGVGSEFFAVIPRRFAGQSEVKDVPEVRREFDSGRLPVLVVEDNAEALFIYEKYLKGTRFQVIPAKNLKEARHALREFRPHAVILDVLLEGEHSWELLQELKNEPSFKGIPVFVVTVVDNREKALATGADGFHAKPVERSWLLHQLDAVTEPVAARYLLVIDDDEISRHIVKTVLGRADFKVIESANGQDGLKRAAMDRPDLIILDLTMPDLSGFEVLSRLKGNPITAEIPVIIYTSKVLQEHERERLGAASAILSKGSHGSGMSLEHFGEALKNAGFALPSERTGEVQHV